MSEKIEGFDPNKKLDTIPFDAEITIKVSGFYYAKFLSMVTRFTNSNQIDLLKAFEELKNREPKNEAEYDFITLMGMCQEIERAAKEQGLHNETTLQDIINAQEASPEN